MNDDDDIMMITMMMIFDDHVEVRWVHLATAVLYVLVILAVVKKCL